MCTPSPFLNYVELPFVLPDVVPPDVWNTYDWKLNVTLFMGIDDGASDRSALVSLIVDGSIL